MQYDEATFQYRINKIMAMGEMACLEMKRYVDEDFLLVI